MEWPQRRGCRVVVINFCAYYMPAKGTVSKTLGARKRSPSKSVKKTSSSRLKRAYPLPKNANKIINQGSLQFNKRNTNRLVNNRKMTLKEFLQLPGVYETLMRLRPQPRLGSLSFNNRNTKKLKRK